MDQNNRHFIGFAVIVAAFIVFVFPRIHEAIYEFMKTTQPEQAEQFATFFCILITVAFFYFLQNWFSGKYR